MQMAFNSTGFFDGFDGPFEELNGLQVPPPGRSWAGSPAGYLISHRINNSSSW